VHYGLNSALLVPLIALGGCGAAANSARITAPQPERSALARVVDLLPTDFEYALVVIDPEAVPDSAAVRRLDAFTVRELDGSMRRKIYLNRESPVLREAVRGTSFYITVLAAIVVHEAAHLAGGTEADARGAETRFFADLMARGLVRAEDGDHYLAVLRQRTAAAHDSARDRDPDRSRHPVGTQLPQALLSAKPGRSSRQVRNERMVFERGKFLEQADSFFRASGVQ
jgi:hypothetical protein